jgi:methyl-accepting chemotaxis protein
VTTDNDNAQDNSIRNQMLCFAGVVGATVGVAVWAYSRKEPTYWEKTRRAAGQLAESAADINPWVGVGAGTAALGGATLALRRKKSKSTLQNASQRAQELVREAGKQMRPGLGTIAAAAISIASALSNAKSRKRTASALVDGTSNAADHVADVGSRIWQRLHTITEEGAKLYPQLKKLRA